MNAFPHTRFFLGVVAAAVLVLGACGDDAEPVSGDPAPEVADDQASDDVDGPTSSEEPTGDQELGVGETALVVPREYLQGDWCDSDGQSWSIDGSTARFDDGAGGSGELPVDLLFIDDVDNELVSQTDDEFVALLAGEEITFSRGSC